MLKRSLILNFLLVLLVVTGLLFAFFNSLNFLTKHGQETKVPKLTGKNMKEAIRVLEKQGFKISIDSTYQSYEDPLEVLFQEPTEGATVKVGRTIFLTVNRRSIPKITMPNLVNLSFRNALLTMQSYRLVMGDTTYRPDVAAGSVLEQWMNGKRVAPGTMIPYGSRIDLVVGDILSEEKEVPNLIGSTYTDAMAIIQSLGLTANPIWDGTITDTANAVIYQQTPETINELDFKNTILVGDLMDLRIMQNPSKEILDKNQPGSRKLIGDEDSAEIQQEELIPANNAKKDTNRRKVPGMNVPSNARKTNQKVSETDIKNALTPVKDKPIGTVPKKPADPLKPKGTVPKKTPTQAPVNKSDDQYKNEYE